VVDGLISNNPGPYTIKISRTSSTDRPEFLYETGAMVRISDDSGNSEVLYENTAGVYQTSETGIQGVVGKKYKLYIKTSDNQEYETDYIELLSPIPIDSVYASPEYKQTEELGIFHKGLQFYVSTHSNLNRESFLLWEPIETYEYNAEYIIEEYYNVEEHGFQSYPNPYQYFTCYRTSTIRNNIFILAAENSNFAIPLHFVSADTKKLSIKYSIFVNQYSIDFNTYEYWNNLKKILTQGTSLYNIQPFKVQGNIKNSHDNNEPVLGYFTVGGHSGKRIFVDPVQPDYYSSWCEPNVDRYGTISAYGSHVKLYATRNEEGQMGLIGGSCIDCRESGGVLERPDFWDNK
jgi:hypothetical protein